MRRQDSCLLSAILAVLLSPLALQGQTGQESVEVRAAQLADKMVKTHEAWRSKITSPGVTIRAVESHREGGIVQFLLYVKGLPTDRLYELVTWPITQPQASTLMEGTSIGKDGLVSCTGRQPGECEDPDPSPEDHGVELTFNPAPGEPFRIAILSGDLRAAIIIVPKPITAKDKNCILAIERLTPGFELANVIGSGYPPNSEVSFESSSHGEKHENKVKSNENGAVQFAMLPFVAGHTSGTTSLKVTGPACSPSLKFDWGR